MEDSTEERYRTSSREFFGKYVDARKRMDYNYFKNYTMERQLFQDKIIDMHIKNKNPCEYPWIIYMCGCYGAGKSHVVRYFENKGQMINENYVHIDPDKIKNFIPETSEIVEKYGEKAGLLLHKEATYISLLIETVALTKNYQCIIDGTLSDHEWYTGYFSHIKSTYTNYKIGIIKVNARLTNILKRCETRSKETGRIIPHELILAIYRKVPKSFDILKKFADIYFEISNDDEIKIASFMFTDC